MCGIAGFIGRAPVSKKNTDRALDLMKNRGPDHRAVREFKDGETHVTLLHTRLSIIDLDPRSNQPFTIDGASLIFNGEIYNYVELKHELEQKGARFATQSDTEVLLRSYLERGEACVQAFEGMWAFAIWDAGKKSLFLSRDRFGEKPLYYWETPEGVYFGSEIKFLAALAGRKPAVNRRHLRRYLVNGYKSLYKTEETFFEGVREIGFATSAVIGPDLKVNRKRYWQPQARRAQMTAEDAAEGLRERLLEAVRLRLRADVPLAFCLSGGIDSASLASIARKKFSYDVAAFSIIDPDERYNEEANIRATIDDLGCKHTLIEIRQGGLLERLAKQVEYHDAPVATISYYVHAFLSEAISRAGYRIAVSGTAADELVTGYYDHYNLHLYEMRNHPEYSARLDEWKRHIKPIVRNPFLRDPELYLKDTAVRDHIYLNNDVFADFLKNGFHEPFREEHYTDGLLRNRMLNELFHEVVPVILHEDDLNSMQYSVENRSPYLDSKLFEFAASIPEEHLIRDGYGKHVLRQAMKGILNEKVRLDRHKKGFNASIHSVIDLDSPKERAAILDDSAVFEFFDREKMEKLITEKPLPNSASKFLFYFLNVKLFLEMNS